MGAKSVLIVDDEWDIREVLTAILGAAGYETATAGNGQEALDYLAEHGAVDGILLDCDMPVMDGPTFVQRYVGTAPIIVVSGRSSSECWQFKGRVRACLRKPVGASDLLQACAAALARSDKEKA